MIKQLPLRKIILAVIVLGVLIAGGLFTAEYLSWKNIKFNLSSNVQSVTIYYANNNPDDDSALVEASTIKSSATVRLKDGSYVVVPAGDKVSNERISLEVTGSTTIDINPYYSDEYLAKTFGGEISAIDAVINAKYPLVATSYTIDDGHFYEYGEWYGTTLYNTSPEPGSIVDIYGIILHKQDGKWVVAAPPNLVFTYRDNPTIPKDVVKLVNQLIYTL